MLFATHASPLPLISGDRLRSYHLMRGLTDLGWRVSLFTLAGDELGRDERLALEGLCDQLHVERTPRPRARFARAALQVVRNRAFQQTFFLRPHARDSLHHWLGGRPFDAIVVGTLYMLAYVPRSLYGSILLDSHNSEALRIASMAEAGGLSPRGVAARLQRGAVLRYERDAVRSVSRTVAVSETEQAELERHAPGRVDLVPNGVDCQALRPRDTVPPGRDVLFVGSLDYGPNVDALEHLVDDVMPLVRGDARLLVVGSNPRPAARRAAARAPIPLDFAGRVPSTEPYFAQARALVVPLRAGGGTRLKILEAFARGTPVITTPAGCEGLDVSSGTELLIAETAEQLAGAIDRLFDDDQLCARLARAGRALVERSYDWGPLAARFQDSLGRAGAPTP